MSAHESIGQNDIADNNVQSNSNSNSNCNNTNDSNKTDPSPPQLFGNFARSAQDVFGNTGRAISNFLPTPPTVPFFQPKFALPDKNVASQVLMYRQLLHTNCRPGLRLSRPYQGTAAQLAVIHMPWWEQGILETQKMVISYDNLIVRLWMHGAIMPFADLMGHEVVTLIDDNGLPPVPHKYWVERLGFQQEDPVTDFRSGGVLSLAMLVHMVESCMPTVKRFHAPNGDASVLPFGITCINVTDMMAKFLMLAKSTDKMEALMSQKPFWRMFADPNAILALQELSMQMLCDVVVEMNRERSIMITSSSLSSKSNSNSFPELPGGGAVDQTNRPVSVFDFSEVLERTERRVRDDLLGAGPSTVEELRMIAAKLATKYQNQLEQKERKAAAASSSSTMEATGHSRNAVHLAVAGAGHMAGSAVVGASHMAAGMLEKIKNTKLPAPSFSNPLNRNDDNNNNNTINAKGSSQPLQTTADLLDSSNGSGTATIIASMEGMSMDGHKQDLPLSSSEAPPGLPKKATISSSSHFSIDDEDIL